MERDGSTAVVKFQFNRSEWKTVGAVPRLVGVTAMAVASLATIESSLPEDKNIAVVTAKLQLMPGRSTTVYLTPSTVALRCVARQLCTISGT